MRRQGGRCSCGPGPRRLYAGPRSSEIGRGHATLAASHRWGLLVRTITSQRAAIREPTPTPHRPFRFACTGARAACSVAAVVLLAAALPAGCSAKDSSGGHTVDSRRMADSVSRYLREQAPGVQISSVNCPQGVKLADGATFQCTAGVAGSQLPVTVTLSNVKIDGDTEEYEYELKPAKALVDTEEVITQIQSQLPAQAANATVACGMPRVQVAAVGGRIACTISLGSRRDRKSTRLNSSHITISYAVFCLKKKKSTESTIYILKQKKIKNKSP